MTSPVFSHWLAAYWPPVKDGGTPEVMQDIGDEAWRVVRRGALAMQNARISVRRVSLTVTDTAFGDPLEWCHFCDQTQFSGEKKVVITAVAASTAEMRTYSAPNE